MTRAFFAAVVASLALPVLALAAMVGQQERLRLNAEIVNVALLGVDPRDLLRGRYLIAEFDWNWQSEPTARDATGIRGGLCVLAGDASKPRVRFIDGWTAGPREGCRAIISGNALPRTNGSRARFIPDGLDAGAGRVNIFVSEALAPELERLLRERPGSLSVDLAVRAGGQATIRAVRVDGQPVGR
jgi:hypothetical protein